MSVLVCEGTEKAAHSQENAAKSSKCVLKNSFAGLIRLERWHLQDKRLHMYRSQHIRLGQLHTCHRLR